MKRNNRYIAAVLSVSMLVSVMLPVPVRASLSNSGTKVEGSVIPVSEPGKISYSDTYDPIRWIKPGQDGRSGSGNDPWRNGLVTGNGENGVIDDGAPESGVLVFQNIQFNFPSNDQRETPELASVMDEVKQTLVNNGEPSSASSNAATKKLTNRAGAWSKNNGLTNSTSWQLKNTYTFHPGMQLRLNMNGLENGRETSFYRYTNYETAEIGSVWTDEKGTWERKSFSSREDNVTTTSIKSKDGNTAFSMNLSIDDISDMSSENKMSGSLEDLRYKKFYKNADNELYIGSVTHYPDYANSELKNGGFASISKIIVKGDNAQINVINGSEISDDRTDEQKSNGVPDETIINVSSSSAGADYKFDTDPTISIQNAEEIILITKSARDKNMCGYEVFAEQTSYALVDKLINDTRAIAGKYTENNVFSYNKALAPHAQKHGDIFKRATVDFKADEADRKLTNEQLIAKAKTEGKNNKTLNAAMLERLYYNGRYANICCSGYQVPRLGGMWTGAWKVEWSGDYTTDANINLQVAGNNIGAMPESSQGFINFILRTVTDWEINAKQVYGIDDAIFAPTRIDGDRAMVVHFNESFPGHIWNSGASWLLLPVYEYWQCYGNQNIPIADDVREMLKITDNTYNKAAQWYSESEPLKVNDTVYNLRNTLGLTDARAVEILEQGYFDLEKDILFPLLTKTCNFYTGFLTPEYYTKDGKAYYEKGKTTLAEDENYLFAPSYSPENLPNGYGNNSYIHLNAVMDISAARDCFNMAKEIAGVIGESINGNTLTADIDKWTAYEEKLPPYLYEPTGELKEWAISDYSENYGHRHISQLYGLWPGYEAESDTTLFNAAKKLIETKNSYPSNDNVAGHSWVHKGLIMARAKSGDGVREALLPTVSQEMHYNSMMTAHNTSGNQAYCTDTTITTPAILTESLLYSDSDTVEVLPAIMDDMLARGGSITGLKTRTGDDAAKIEWNNTSVTININTSDTVNVKCGKAFKAATVNGTNAEIKADVSGEPYVEVLGESTVVFTFADIDNGTYTISASDKRIIPETSVDGSEVTVTDSTGSKTKWNLTRMADGTYTIENAYHGRYLTNKNEKVYMKRTAADGESIYWTVNESGYLVSVSGKYLYLDGNTLKLGDSPAKLTFTSEKDTLTEYSADNISISTDTDLSQPVDAGKSVNFNLTTEPAAAKSKTVVWSVAAKDGTPLTKTRITNGTLKIGTDAILKTLTVKAQSEDGACVSNEITLTVSDTELITVTCGPYWADEVTNNQGSNGNLAPESFGKFQNTDDTVRLFFAEASDGKDIGSLKRINGLDNENNAAWKGNVIKTVNVENAGVYTVYILGYTGDANRLFEVTNLTNGETSQTQLSGEITAYSTSNNMKIFSADVGLKKGENELKLQAPSGHSAPNFVALYLQSEIAKPDYTVYWVGDETVDTSNIGTSGAVSKISLGNTQNTDEISAMFGFDSDGEAVNINRVNALDNQTDTK